MPVRTSALVAAALAFAGLPAAAETIRVEMKNVGYEPAEISAHVGDTIEWVNGDILAHTATSRRKEWDVTILPNKTGRITLKQSGQIHYYCRFHPNMVGRISVAE